jgi:hypothetical protein
VYFFAHLFSGILIGTVLFHLRKDRWIFPVCIAGALFSDLLDKPLSLLMPDIFGSTRTIGHTLIVALIFLIAACILWQRYGNILGMVFAGTVLLHQVLDMLWTVPVTWFFPLHGMFEKSPAAGGFMQFFLIEAMNPSEWVFVLASYVFITSWYTVICHDPASLYDGIPAPVRYGLAAVLGITGISLVIAGVGLLSGPVPAPDHGPDKILMAGLVAMGGAIALCLIPVRKWPALR